MNMTMIFKIVITIKKQTTKINNSLSNNSSRKRKQYVEYSNKESFIYFLREYKIIITFLSNIGPSIIKTIEQLQVTTSPIIFTTYSYIFSLLKDLARFSDIKTQPVCKQPIIKISDLQINSVSRISNIHSDVMLELCCKEKGMDDAFLKGLKDMIHITGAAQYRQTLICWLKSKGLLPNEVNSAQLSLEVQDEDVERNRQNQEINSNEIQLRQVINNYNYENTAQISRFPQEIIDDSKFYETVLLIKELDIDRQKKISTLNHLIDDLYISMTDLQPQVDQLNHKLNDINIYINTLKTRISRIRNCKSL